MSENLKDIQQRLDEVSAKLRARKKANTHLYRCYEELKQLQGHRKELFDILKKEEADVNKLESMSVNALFRLFLKSKEEQLEIEQQEYVVAAMKYNECLDSLQLIEYEIDVLERLIDETDELESRHDALMAKKELALKSEYPAVATMLSNLDYKSTLRRLELREINEALVAGEKARVKLIEILKLLEKVEGWGAWGATQYTSKYTKTPFVDRARKTAVEARMLLRRFEQELKDVFKNLHVRDDFTLDAFDHFLSIFYDNLITDWIVQNNLRHTQNSLSGTFAKVDRLIASLEHEKNVINKALEDFETQKVNLILTNT